MMLLAGVIVAMAVIPVNNTDTLFQTTETRTGPEDGPNQPIGEAKGYIPGTGSVGMESGSNKRKVST